MKKLILVTSPPACGKTFVSKEISKALEHVVYLDKDTLIGLSKQIFKVAHEENNRSSDFFEKYIRDYEYDVILDLALEALEYDDTALINAPFSREIRDDNYMYNLAERLAQKGIRLLIIWVETPVEVCHQRMITRNSDRDTWKLENWSEYISRCNFNIPTNLSKLHSNIQLETFDNSSVATFQTAINKIIAAVKA